MSKTHTTYVNYSDIVAVDEMIDALKTHRAITTNDVVQKAMDLVVKIDTTGDTLYTVIGETGEYHHVNVADMTCSCTAGQHNQNCSHALAAAMRHIKLSDGVKLTIETEKVDDNFLVIFS